jgi:hypothetical protein
MEFYQSAEKRAKDLAGTWPRLLATLLVHVIAFLVALKWGDQESRIYYLLVFGVIAPFIYLLTIKKILLNKDNTIQHSSGDSRR